MHPMISGTKMTANSSMGFGPASSYNRPLIPQQSGAMSSLAGMAPGVVNNFGGINGTMETMMAGNPSMMNDPTPVSLGRRSSNLHPDPVPGLRCDPGVAVHWSFEEQAILRDGLVKYAGMPNIMKYIKIAAMLREKTVRDVALRCRWINRKENGKRRKAEEQYAGKKIKDAKEKILDSSPSANASYCDNSIANYPHMMHPVRPSYQLSSEDSCVDATTHQCMDENVQLLHQVAANLAESKIHENVDLFNWMRSNIVTSLNNMSQTPGMMSQMPPLPESVDVQLVNELNNLNKMFVMLCQQQSSQLQ